MLVGVVVGVMSVYWVGCFGVGGIKKFCKY